VCDALSISPSTFGAGLAADDLILTLYFITIYSLAKHIPPDPPAQQQPADGQQQQQQQQAAAGSLPPAAAGAAGASSSGSGGGHGGVGGRNINVSGRHSTS
jgi:hypothetical protein